MMNSSAELLKKTKRVWSKFDAPAPEDMQSLKWDSDEEVVEAFMGVRPVDVDIKSSGFQASTPLMELPSRAAAAYLGTFLISLLAGLELEEKVGFPTDIMTRAHTLSVMTDPDFWPEIAGPYLQPDCLELIGEIAVLLIAKRETFILTDDEVARFERLIRSINRELGR